MPSPTRTLAQAVAGAPSAPPAASAPALGPLPRPVLDACRMYAAGDANEEAMNLQEARRMWSMGSDARDIVAVIRHGAPEPQFIG